ncbi:MAG: DUF1080 domain-containing protein [Prolixibacteraceae bacterium]|nr:DUF1080 domain-containing protein [Prolixibacteraceae bacterium]
MRKFTLLLFLLIFISDGITLAQNGGWENLFNGKDLTGWKQLNGKAKYTVEDGAIVGTTVLNTPNSFLCTTKEYSDFIFEVDIFIENSMNSGIQFRSESKVDFQNGIVHGYQCEIDPSVRAWSGGIYDEARRGWLYPLDVNPDAKSALKMGQWNRYRIECIGNSIKTWLNGVACAHVIDDMTPSGFIALQVHSIGGDQSQEGLQIKWKNIRIKTTDLEPAPSEGIYVVNLIPNHLCEAEKEQGFELLFDGKTGDAWKNSRSGSFPENGWEIKDGVMSVLSSKQSPQRGGDIITKEEFGPFELKFDFNITEGANSGIKYGIGNNGPGIGLEYQILDDERHPDAKGGVVGNRKLASLYDLIPAEKEDRFVNGPGSWNRGRIVVFPDGKIQHWLNGRKVVEYNRGDAIYRALVARSKYADYENFGMAPKSPVLLQDHQDNVKFRSIKIREL